MVPEPRNLNFDEFLRYEVLKKIWNNGRRKRKKTPGHRDDETLGIMLDCALLRTGQELHPVEVGPRLNDRRGLIVPLRLVLGRNGDDMRSRGKVAVLLVCQARFGRGRRGRDDDE